MSVSRRAFVQAAGVGLLGTGLSLPSFERARSARPETLVCLFQRGALDGLSLVVQHGDDAYYRERPRIAIPREDVLDLDGYFGLHPRLAPLEPLWREGSLAVVHAVGLPGPTRSHGEAQRDLETGTPGRRDTNDGWANRYCAIASGDGAARIRAVAAGSPLPRVLAGRAPALPLETLPTAGEVSDGPWNDARYPGSPLGRSLRRIAQIIRADTGVAIAVVDTDGWDTHVDQGASQGRLADRLDDLGRGLAAFRRDLGERMRHVVVLTLSEFGRSVGENPHGGTDHGRATAMLAMGGPVRGGRVFGDWPGLGSAVRDGGSGLAVTTDVRDLLSEVLSRHLRARDLGPVFPGHDVACARFPGVIRG